LHFFDQDANAKTRRRPAKFDATAAAAERVEVTTLLEAAHDLVEVVARHVVGNADVGDADALLGPQTDVDQHPQGVVGELAQPHDGASPACRKKCSCTRAAIDSSTRCGTSGGTTQRPPAATVARDSSRRSTKVISPASTSRRAH